MTMITSPIPFGVLVMPTLTVVPPRSQLAEMKKFPIARFFLQSGGNFAGGVLINRQVKILRVILGAYSLRR
ncbi:hypothetical protein NHH03_21160 [Stieleria sp. TO1_6]|uniref:hypothetical protein n=1 Tax=Stieleria tagensis TaxID=2956795 RepID=UPI00209B9C22|nr:hypothetical protein [Stieleria tagensis]MCO8124265.1 hypothetical protein [Stieleria tagensis]